MALTKICSSFRFQGQTKLNKSKPSDFKMAIEEAILAEYGYMDLEECPQNSSLNQAGVKGCFVGCGDAAQVAYAGKDEQVVLKRRQITWSSDFFIK